MASSGSTTEALSVNRAFRAICRSDIVALVIEAMACITEQVSCRKGKVIRAPQAKPNLYPTYFWNTWKTMFISTEVQVQCSTNKCQ